MAGDAQGAFPWLKRPREQYRGVFDDNVQLFLRHHGKKTFVKGVGRNRSAWIVPLAWQDGAINLHVYQERLPDDSNPICDQCRNIGWQHHPVCDNTYHFVLPSAEVLSDDNSLPSLIEAKYAGKVKKAAYSGVEQEDDDEEDCPFVAPASMYESPTHLLHGVLHCNGFGHLIRTNAREAAAGGAPALSGRQLIGLWDELCSLLCARQVTVEDVSTKSGMLLRLLHSAAYGITWYGKWQYNLGRGPYHISTEQYNQAVARIKAAPLDALVADFEALAASGAAVPSLTAPQQRLVGFPLNRVSPAASLPGIVRRYSMLDPSVTTFGGLAQLVLRVLSQPAAYAGRLSGDLFRLVQAAAAAAAAAQHDGSSGGAAGGGGGGKKKAPSARKSGSGGGSSVAGGSGSKAKASGAAATPGDGAAGVAKKQRTDGTAAGAPAAAKPRKAASGSAAGPSSGGGGACSDDDDGGDRPSGPKPMSPERRAQLAGPSPPDLELSCQDEMPVFNPKEHIKRFTGPRLAKAITAVVAVVAGKPGCWVPRQEVREQALLQPGIQDKSLIDSVLKALANTVVNGFALHRCRSRLYKHHFYLAVPVEAGAVAPLLEVTAATAAAAASAAAAAAAPPKVAVTAAAPSALAAALAAAATGGGAATGGAAPAAAAAAAAAAATAAATAAAAAAAAATAAGPSRAAPEPAGPPSPGGGGGPGGSTAVLGSRAPAATAATLTAAAAAAKLAATASTAAAAAAATRQQPASAASSALPPPSKARGGKRGKAESAGQDAAAAPQAAGQSSAAGSATAGTSKPSATPPPPPPAASTVPLRSQPQQQQPSSSKPPPPPPTTTTKKKRAADSGSVVLLPPPAPAVAAATVGAPATAGDGDAANRSVKMRRVLRELDLVEPSGAKTAAAEAAGAAAAAAAAAATAVKKEDPSSATAPAAAAASAPPSAPLAATALAPPATLAGQPPPPPQQQQQVLTLPVPLPPPGTVVPLVHPDHVRQQALIDLQSLYRHVLIGYTPAQALLHAAGGGKAGAAGPSAGSKAAAPLGAGPPPGGPPHSAPGRGGAAAAGRPAPDVLACLRLRHMADDVQVVADSKHFVKDFGGPLARPRADPDELRLLVNVAIPPTPDHTAVKAERVKRLRATPRQLHVLPPQVVLSSAGATVTQLKTQITSSLRSTYRMFRALNLGAGAKLSGLERSGPAAKLGPLADGHALTLDLRACDAAACGINYEPRWQHAGGLEDWDVLCACGTQDDDGERMICCDACTVWMHTRCNGIRDEAPVPAHFVCPWCLGQL